MSDLIDRQAAIDAITKALDREGILNRIVRSRAIRAVNTLPAANRWIPWDSGKFPEESGTYTVTAYDGATKRVTYAKYQKRLKRWELTGARAYWRVLAWMPLPEPYTKEEEDGTVN